MGAAHMRRVALACTALLLISCSGDDAARANRRGNAAFAEQQYEVALASYQDVLEGEPDQPQALYNLGNTQYRLQESEEAQIALEQAARAAAASDAAGDALGAQAWYNLGNVRYGLEDYAGAVDAYQEALRRTPSDIDAKANLELALRKLQENDQQEDGSPESTPTPTPSPTPDPSSAEEETTPTATPTEVPSATPGATEPPPSPGEQTPEASATPQMTPSPGMTPTPVQQPEGQGDTAGATPGITPTAELPVPASPGQLSAEQALRILEAAAGETQTLQEALQQEDAPPAESVEKDW